MLICCKDKSGNVVWEGEIPDWKRDWYLAEWPDFSDEIFDVSDVVGKVLEVRQRRFIKTRRWRKVNKAIVFKEV